LNPRGIPPGQVIAALGLLIAISAVALAFWRRSPYLLVGWLWYVGMMVPVIGLVQISYYARADRYTYLPQIGIYVMVIWGAAELAARLRARRYVSVFAALLLIATLIPPARAQVSRWRDSHTLWSHAVKTSAGNYVAHNNLGFAAASSGDMETAISHFRKALELRPGYYEAHTNIGTGAPSTGPHAGGHQRI
jgi:tetratricopeptide (TPR) repeat protein